MKKSILLSSVLVLLFLVSACGTGTLHIKTEKMGRPASMEYSIMKGSSAVFQGKTDKNGEAEHTLKQGKYEVVIPNGLFNHSISAQVVNGQVSQVYENLGTVNFKTNKVDPQKMMLYDYLNHNYSIKTDPGGDLVLYLPELTSSTDYQYIVAYENNRNKIEVRHNTPTPVVLMWSS